MGIAVVLYEENTLYSTMLRRSIREERTTQETRTNSWPTGKRNFHNIISATNCFSLSLSLLSIKISTGAALFRSLRKPAQRRVVRAGLRAT